MTTFNLFLTLAAVSACSATFAAGFLLCDRLKDRRAERAEAKLRTLARGH